MNPKVTILITTYLEKSKPYLDLCIEAVKHLDYPKECLEILLIARKSYMPHYEGVTTIAPPEDEYFPARGINFGMREASKDSKYFFILNDDTICTKDALINLVIACEVHQPPRMMANATSPCENGFQYHLLFGIPKPGMKSFIQLDKKEFRIDEFGPGKIIDFDELMNAQSCYLAPGVICMPFLCIFATLIPRHVYELVGDWDENFKCGQDDLDYSWRAKQKGIECVAVLNSLVWHFSGVTAESTMNLKRRQENVRYFRDKWGCLPPGIPSSFLEQS